MMKKVALIFFIVVLLSSFLLYLNLGTLTPTTTSTSTYNSSIESTSKHISRIDDVAMDLTKTSFSVGNMFTAFPRAVKSLITDKKVVNNNTTNIYMKSDGSNIMENNVIFNENDNIVAVNLPQAEKDLEINPVKLVKEDPISTFSVDIDDGSYKLFKQYVNSGNLLDENLIRVEEFVNAFHYDYPAASNIEVPFSTTLKVTKSPWSENHLILIGIKGFEYTIDSLPPVNLTFLIDVSGSMSNYLSQVKAGLNMLVEQLRPEDSISIVTYAGATKVVLESTKVEDKDKIKDKINQLIGGGGTNGEAGVLLAYKENQDNFIENGVNRIILMSDGDFNVGLSSTKELEELIEEKRKNGTTFSTIGLGGGNYRDSMMETMSNKGNGNYTYIGDMNDAREVFADRFISTIKNIAKDVKYQVEFNDDNVKEYRLIGYENRMLKTEDFNNDKVDAGEITSGTTTTAIYEITLKDQEGLFPDSRYEKEESKSDNFSEELAFLKIRFKQPNGDKSQLLTFPINKSLIDSKLTTDNILAINVAGFAQIYKDSKYIKNNFTYDNIIENIKDLDLKDSQVEFRNILKTTKLLKE